MQTDPASARTTLAAHTLNQNPNLAVGQIVVDDQRLRAFALASSGGLTNAYEFRVQITGDGNFLRVRTLANNLIDVAYATPATTLTWTTVPAASYNGGAVFSAKAGAGIALYVNGSAVDMFWLDSDGVSIRTSHSTDNGHSWGAKVLVTTLFVQPSTTLVRFSAPAANILFGTGSAGGTGTSIWYSTFNGTSWSAKAFWDLSNSTLGIEAPLNLFGLGAYNSTLDVIQVGANYLFTFYGGSPRGETDSGIWTLMAYPNGSGGFSWGELKNVYVSSLSSPQLQNGGSSQLAGLFCALPALQSIGGQYWLTAIQSSYFGGVNSAFLAFWISSDGVHWAERQYLMGYSSDPAQQTGVCQYSNGGAVNYAATDFMYGKVLVSGMNFFVFGYDKAFVCPATSLCGVTNPARQLDISAAVPQYSISEPPAGQAVSATLQLLNPVSQYNNHPLLLDGARVVQKMGYGADLVQVQVANIDEVDQETEINVNGDLKNVLPIKTLDYIDKLAKWKADLYYEFASGLRMNLSQINDLTAFSVMNGTFFATGGVLHPGALDATANVPDNLLILANQARTRDGFLEIPFQLANAISHNGINDYVGIALQVKDNQNYYAVLYNRTSGKFSLVQAAPSAPGAAQIVAYGADLAVSAAIALAPNGTYWMRVQQWHNSVAVYWASGLGQVQPTAISTAAGGSLAASTTYYYKITGIDALTGEESIGSIEISATTTTTNKSMVLNWAALPGAGAYNIYRTTTAGVYSANSFLASLGNVTTWTDTGANGFGAGTPPVTPLNQRHVWQLAFNYTGLPSNAAYWGIVCTGTLTNSAPIGESNQLQNADLNYYQTLNEPDYTQNPLGPGQRIDCFVRVLNPGTGVLRSLAAVIDRYASAVPYIPDVIISLVADNGAGTAPASLNNPANILFSATLFAPAIPVYLSALVPWSTLPATTIVNLSPNTYYWIWIHSTGNMGVTNGRLTGGAVPAQLLYTPGAIAQNNYPSLIIYNGTLTSFANLNDTQAAFLAVIYTAVQASGFTVQGLNFGSSEPQYALEFIATDLAVKAGMNGVTLDSTLSDSFSGALDSGSDSATVAHNWFSGMVGTFTAGSGYLAGQGPGASAYGFLRSNLYRGVIGDTLIDVDMTLLGSTVQAGLLFRASGDPSQSTLSGYYLEFAPNSPYSRIVLYSIANNALTKLGESICLIPLPINQTFHVTVSENAGYHSVYINEALCASFFDLRITANGYVGFAAYGNLSGGAVARWDNYRVPDIMATTPYFAIEAYKTGKENLDRLLGKERYLYYARFDGSLRLSRFMNRAPVDTYTSTMMQTTKTLSGRYWRSHLRPQGTYYADLFDSVLLDQRGRRFEYQNYSDAFTDAQAYADGATAIRKMRELGSQYLLVAAAVPAAEREDRVTITNPLDGVAADYILNDLTFDVNVNVDGTFTFDERVGLRAFIS